MLPHRNIASNDDPARRHHARTVRALSVLVAGVVVFGACGDDDADDDLPVGFRYAASQVCTDVLNERDRAIADARTDAVVAIHEQRIDGAAPSDEDTANWAAALETWAGELQRTHDRLASLDPADGDDAEGWATILADGDAIIEEVGRRVSLLRQHDWDTVVADIGSSGDDADARFAAIDALDALGMQERDCAVVFHASGSPSSHRRFIAAASSACSRIVSRRQADDTVTSTVIIEAVAAAVQDEPVIPTEQLVTAVDDSIREWKQTLTDLESVPTDDVPDLDEWELTIAMAADRLAGFEQRGEALDSGDADLIADAFRPSSVFEIDGSGDLVALGLADRECKHL